GASGGRARPADRPRDTSWTCWRRKNARVVRVVEAAIRAGGPLGNADFQHAPPRGAAGWWNWKPSTHALHYLWMSGRIMVHSRAHFQKRFDLAERVIPAASGPEPPGADEFIRWHLRRSLRAMGAATELDLRMYL